MFKLLHRIRLLHKPTFGDILSGCMRPATTAYNSPCSKTPRHYSTAADNRYPPRWVQLEPELDEALVPRKLSVSPLETWLSLRYSLPPLPELALPKQEHSDLLEEKVLPPMGIADFEDGDSPAMPLSCKNDLEIRRRKMNRHKYKKLRKRTKFLRRRVQESRGKKKQKRFEDDLQRIWRRAGLKKAPEGWETPKIFIKQHGNRKN
ncbi:aurora kinase A-interacting protein [Corythoichthys intestinalis]|uniref:aurora kinase A-interacting protein n=1 Tax=Corythoichthys intestinalis TaxID=161448 RepID=UPI0025A55E22|nr:aurora kinase A-interacting protein [Corythoichthys intestinalis]XP_057712095.1 aurora kinase A-interacting protein [Corythoichthys intestinalis]XP_057712103.1 aurora kinase A-interacting protein [Corythoichthys intestinalis]